jgi:DNA primase
MARCVFHDDRNPSLSLDEGSGLYYCFGCQASGDTVTFVERYHHLNFREAVEWLADRAGITITLEESEEARLARLHRRQLHAAVGSAAEWYHEQLFESPEAKNARDYLRTKRRIDGEAARRFKIGWAPAGGSIAPTLHTSKEVAIESGVSSSDEASGRTYDTLRSRIVLPIFDASGKPIGLGGRILPGGTGPKYLNFAETPLYRKREVLYGLNWAKRAIVAADEAVVCEGALDVVAFHLSGVEQAVATCGVALTDDHVTVLGRFAKRIVVAFDPDGAGQGAIDRLHQWEKTHRVAFAVAMFPDELDPAALYERGDSDQLVEIIAQARPLLGWRLDRLFASVDLETPETRVAAADKAMGFVMEHPDRRVAQQYIQVIADTCHVDPTPLRRQLETRPEASAPTQKPSGDVPLPVIEEQALSYAIHHPYHVAGWFDESLLSHPVARRAARAILEADELADAVMRADSKASALISRLDAYGDALFPSDQELAELRDRLIVASAERALRRAGTRASQDPEAADEQLAISTWLQRALEAGREKDQATLEELRVWLKDNDEPVLVEFDNPAAEIESAAGAVRGTALAGTQDLSRENVEEWL